MAMQLQGHCIIHCSSNAHKKLKVYLKIIQLLLLYFRHCENAHEPLFFFF